MGGHMSKDTSGNKLPQKMSAKCFDDCREIGKGAFGDVRIARSALTGELKAIKIVQKASLFRNGKNHSELLQIERDSMIRCQSGSHRSNFTVPLEHAFQDESSLYLVMPLYTGGDLRQLIRSSRWKKEISKHTKNSALRFYFAEVMLGIQDMHNIGLCHRDIKPRNIFIDSDGHLAVGDFGLVKAMTRDSRTGCLSQSSMEWGQAGTYGYRAPEVAKDQYADWAADVWSLGVLFYEMNCGRRPWAKESDFREPLVFTQSDDPDLMDLISLMLIIDPVDRPSLQTLSGHKFFRSIDWVMAGKKRLDPPVLPSLNLRVNYLLESSPATASTASPKASSPRRLSSVGRSSKPSELKSEWQMMFEDFDYHDTIEVKKSSCKSTSSRFTWAGAARSERTRQSKAGLLRRSATRSWRRAISFL